MSQMGGTFVASVPAVPVGSMQAFAGSSAPTGWLLCNGTTASRTTYSNLFSVIGTTYGVGDGSTTFGLPDMRGRVPMGAGTGTQQGGTGSGVITGGTSLAARTAGQFGGDERGQAHAHALTIANSGALPIYRSGAGTGGRWITTLGVGTGDYLLYGTDDNQINANTAIPGGGMLGTGGNMPPFVVLNYIIKAIPDTPRGGMTATFTPPIVTSLPLVPQFGDQVAYQFTGTNNVGALLLMQYNGTAWKPLGQATLCRWSSGSASQVISSTAVANMTNGDYNTVTFTPPWDGYYEIGINLQNVQLTTGIGLYVLFNSLTDTYSHQLAYFEDANGYTYHTRIPVTGPRTEYLYAAQTYRWKSVITYASGNQGTIFSAGNAYVKAVA